MADANFSTASRPVHTPPHSAPHPMANPGYGKRSVPGQGPRTAGDFLHLPPREGAIATYVDRLPEGTDISVKTLAKHLPYGQCALRTALNRIQAAGHLRRGREHVIGGDGGSARWVTRTWYSRTPRDDAWWAAYTRGDVPDESEGDRRPTRSRAFILLAALGRTAPALSLSYTDCVALEPQVTQWFERGAAEPDVLRALTCGLPTPVHSPAALVRSRLVSKLPPEPPVRPKARRVLECAVCRAPGSAEALPGGVCGPCRGEPGPAREAASLRPAQVRAHAAAVRTALPAPAARTGVRR
ncbi:MarR family transcriptional regulator OS=Streptomyces alboniger OX=132473 GN=CP975_11915 PE=4 SV=1 [Streptomyces alboniger]